MLIKLIVWKTAKKYCCVPLHRSESCVSVVNASLKIINVQFEDAGQYKCEVLAPDHLLDAVTYLHVHSKLAVEYHMYVHAFAHTRLHACWQACTQHRLLNV